MTATYLFGGNLTHFLTKSHSSEAALRALQKGNRSEGEWQIVKRRALSPSSPLPFPLSSYPPFFSPPPSFPLLSLPWGARGEREGEREKGERGEAGGGGREEGGRRKEVEGKTGRKRRGKEGEREGREEGERGGRRKGKGGRGEREEKGGEGGGEGKGEGGGGRGRKEREGRGEGGRGRRRGEKEGKGERRDD